MNGDWIEARGDELERRIPLLAAVWNEVGRAVTETRDILADNWAEGATDETSLDAWSTFRQVMDGGVTPTVLGVQSVLGAYHGGTQAVAGVYDLAELDNTVPGAFTPGAGPHHG